MRYPSTGDFKVQTGKGDIAVSAATAAATAACDKISIDERDGKMNRTSASHANAARCCCCVSSRITTSAAGVLQG